MKIFDNNFIIFLNIFSLVFFIFALICFINQKRITGFFGEFWVKRELKKLDKNIYKTINDTLFLVDDTTHQIDHIVVSKFGIFVIETKQYNGYIKGNEYDKKWIINNKIYINNPIHQNYGHIKNLEKVLDLQENKFIPIVCIPSTAKVNVKSKGHIARIYELNKIILSYTNEILPEYNDIYDRIIELRITDKNIKKQHNKRVKQIEKERNNHIDKNKCPICEGDLVERTGEYGKFIGCSNYPKCKFTRKY